MTVGDGSRVCSFGAFYKRAWPAISSLSCWPLIGTKCQRKAFIEHGSHFIAHIAVSDFIIKRNLHWGPKLITWNAHAIFQRNKNALKFVLKREYGEICSSFIIRKLTSLIAFSRKLFIIFYVNISHQSQDEFQRIYVIFHSNRNYICSAVYLFNFFQFWQIYYLEKI